MTGDSGPLAFVCPAPLRRYPQVVLGHGSGGVMTNELIENLFAPAFGMTDGLGDAAVLDADEALRAGGRLVLTTDSFVVAPPVFPGGDIGDLAVNGTVNDLAMMGARPLYLSAGFVLEEGLEMAVLGRIVASMARAAQSAGVRVVTGDTKVVERGHGDGIYINTSGVGVLDAPPGPHPRRIAPGDALLINGTLGDHGVAVMSLRNGLGLESEVMSDCAPLNGLVEEMRTACPDIHALRDLTRGGLASAANELAEAAGVGLEVNEAAVPVLPAVAGACEILGLDPLQVANEGKLLAAVPDADADAVLAAMRAHPLGRKAACIGRATDAHSGVVVGQTAIGGQRVIDMPAGVLLPRIC